MKILYKVCFSEDRLQSRPLCNSIQDMVSACLNSIVKQMSKDDEIIFFCDGADPLDILHRVCDQYNIKHDIKTFNHGCGAQLNNECVLYIINNIEDNNELIYLCEDDYLHYNNCLQHIKDFLIQYPDYFCHPIDYPNLYDPGYNESSDILLSKNWHWRSIKTTTYTIAFTKALFDKSYSILTNINRSLFYDHIINLLYVYNKCYSPIPSLTSHIEKDCLSPCIDNKKIFEENLNFE